MSALATVGAVAVIGSAAFGQLTADERKCTDAAYKSARNVGNQEQKGNRTCVKDGAGNIDACVDAESAKAADKRAKLLELDDPGGKCATTPAFGLNANLADVADGVEDGTDNILRGAFGDPVDVGVAGDKCGDAVAKRSGKAYDAILKSFRGCAKGLGAINSIADLNGCALTAVADAKAANFVPTKLANDMTKKCTFMSPPNGMEDGDCSSCSDGPTCAACVARITRCQACKAINNETGGSANCDLGDDGLANGSCIECGIAPGSYTITQTAGGTLRVATFAPFPFPAGGSINQDVGAGDANCVHSTVVPYPGGFSVPIFCVPALGATTQVTQTGCGIGRIDSNGGSDFTITEDGDTSELAVCGALQGVCPPAGPAPDSSGRLDVKVGDGVVDVCGSGIANAAVTIPVNTLTWVAADASCPDTDSTFNMGTDTKLAEFPQTLDFTTDKTTARFFDISGDACAKSGLGPNGPFTETGVCLDIGGATVTTVAAGAIFSSGGPTYDLLFSTKVPNTIAGPGAPLGAVCGSPPLINFAGTANRCFNAP